MDNPQKFRARLKVLRLITEQQLEIIHDLEKDLGDTGLLDLKRLEQLKALFNKSKSEPKPLEFKPDSESEKDYEISAIEIAYDRDKNIIYFQCDEKDVNDRVIEKTIKYIGCKDPEIKFLGR